MTFDDFLSELEVPHTAWYSRRQFGSMTFKSLFGLSELLKAYGIDSEAYELASKGDVSRLTPPFVAATDKGCVLVTELSPLWVRLRDGDDVSRLSRTDFDRAFTGTVLLAFPTETSEEPHLEAHRFTAFGNKAKGWVLAAAVTLIVLYLFVSNGIYRHPSMVLLTLIDLAGIYVGYELVLKALNIRSSRGTRCGL